MSLPVVRSNTDNIDLNLFLSTYLFNREDWNSEIARSLGLFWFDQAVLLDAVSSIETGFEWQTFSGEKLNFTKWAFGHPQIYDGVTFSIYQPNITDNATVLKSKIVKFIILFVFRYSLCRPHWTRQSISCVSRIWSIVNTI